jgi:small subunit ribosomal protein S6
MRTSYETMFLLPPTITDELVEDIINRLKRSVEKRHGEVVNVVKMGVRKTAYEVNKQRSAYYVLLQYQAGGDVIAEVERTLRNTDEVIKFLSTKVTTKPVPVLAAMKTTSEDSPVAPTITDAGATLPGDSSEGA